MQVTSRTQRTTSRRERLVRQEIMRRGITLSQAAEEMGIGASALSWIFVSPRPRAPTLERLRIWLHKHGVRRHDGEPLTNADLAR